MRAVLAIRFDRSNLILVQDSYIIMRPFSSDLESRLSLPAPTPGAATIPDDITLAPVVRDDQQVAWTPAALLSNDESARDRLPIPIVGAGLPPAAEANGENGGGAAPQWVLRRLSPRPWTTCDVVC